MYLYWLFLESTSVSHTNRYSQYPLSSLSLLQNKEFIFRGLEYEKLGQFTDRILSEFPGATLLNQTTAPTDNLKNGDSLCILKVLNF